MNDLPQRAGAPGKKRNTPLAKLSPATNPLKGKNIEDLENSFVEHLEFSLAKDQFSATLRDCYKAMALSARDRLFERWIVTQQAYYQHDAKRVYYLSLEFLMGRLLGDALVNLDLYGNAYNAMEELGFNLEELRDMEPDAGLGNGGLGRLAACFMDSLATLQLPAYGYGIRYEYGIFCQKIVNGRQIEAPDNWLRYGNPWEIERPEYIYPVKFYGRVHEYTDADGKLRHDWLETDDVIAMAYDTPVPGFRNNTVNNLRLWSAQSSEAFNLDYFNHGDYERAVADQIDSEKISKLLYPRDDFSAGKELRLKQQYFLVSATLQDIIRRFKKSHQSNFAVFPDKVAVQLNDTHPALAIPELMRLLMDSEGLGWEQAWEICVRTFGYTNHTVLPEALERWNVPLIQRLLPRHLQIIYEINRHFLDEIAGRFPNDIERRRRMSLIEESSPKHLRMANLAIAGSHSVNGVATLHTEILKQQVFKDFCELWPEKFNNKTNGITPRRWLMLCNWELAQLITDHIGEGWKKDLFELKKLKPLSQDEGFQIQWRQVKQRNKQRLADIIHARCGVKISPDSLFDCHVKRIHEYKRQLLNVLHVITLYNRLKANPQQRWTPRTVIFAGKAAPGYAMAKLIIQLINAVAEKINDDVEIGDNLKVVFVPDYSVTLAQKIIPAADLSEQISTAGMEASGTGNMKFALNGALTIGTLDGANIEIMEEVGRENIFSFGLTAAEVQQTRLSGYDPRQHYQNNAELKQAIDMVASGYFSPAEPGLFHAITSSLLDRGDFYMVLADYAAYVACQASVSSEYQDQANWTRKSILNAANMGKFSSDRTIKEYAEEIWQVRPVPIKL
jgi:starch phosphorylase